MAEALDVSIFTHFKFILVATWTDPAHGQGNKPLSNQNLQSANKAGQDHGPEPQINNLGAVIKNMFF